MKTLYLVDATYELFRNWFGAPPRQDPDGREVGAVHGLCASMLTLLRERGVTHAACATDHTVESFRNDLYDGYKTSEGMDEDLLALFPVAEEALAALGLVVWPMVEFEADDALATGARKYRRAFEQIRIATPDKDLSQCVVGRSVVQWDRRKDEVRDEDGVRARFGVPPASVPDWLALVGDSADGIPGVPGWGARSSSAVLAAYGTIERIPRDAASWTVKVRGAARLAESLAAHEAEVALYKRLTVLRTDVPLEERSMDLAWRGVPRPRWERFCERLGFRGLAARPHVWR